MKILSLSLVHLDIMKITAIYHISHSQQLTVDNIFIFFFKPVYEPN